MSTPAAKRRRVDAASALHKPFKSPFRTPLKPQTDSPAIANPTEDTTTPTSSLARTPNPRNPTYTPARTPVRTSNALRPNSTNTQLIALRAEIQTLTQATALATSSTDADLEVLIDRWRTASRAAAEELFANTRDRVNRMGGVGAWRDRERDQRDRNAKWEREEREAEMAEAKERLRAAREEEGGGGSGEREEREYEEAEREDEGGEEEQREAVRDEGPDDDSFTMDMMLKTLNIDLEVIGYDRVGQRWVG
ncbi:uncharacterized protein BDZ99DRAFT_445369 [Mytilinidion resinicola]|uniref:DNA repair protein Dds20/Mei5 n=1 Tax=Mytilinidion resinicola TaxID=574789 RepID=A0A6A6YJK8_9PEZI|nr:uncharacterized protein BDZ99DRAFT_445369 [Mytilinidion resinicola]KAF2808174.1 hypothetical protein BDZ99DRAFT_445369 [Mytilinidion resinicola]